MIPDRNWQDLFLNNYGSPSIEIVRGEGSRVWDSRGREYIDLLGGIAVNSIGVGDPRFTAAVSEQVSTLVHTSNLYSNVPSQELAQRLNELSGMAGARIFLCNSGAEANEAAFKLARLTKRREIIVLQGSFHGRTMGALALTAQPAKQQPFEPLPAGVRVVAPNDLIELRSVISTDTAALFVEPIQGENGVIPLTPEYLQGCRELTREHGALLIVDEVQTGIGRTGKWWAHQHSKVTPDVMTLAKGLGGGLPIGAMIVGEPSAHLFTPGSHGSTFGGNPVVAAAALAVLDIIESDDLLARCTELGERFAVELESASCGLVSHIRGRGLLLAAVFHADIAKDFELVAREHGLLVNAVAPNAVRLAPALTLSDIEFKEAIERWRFAAAALMDHRNTRDDS